MTLIPIATPSVLAACNGNGSPYSSSSGWAFEGPQNGTCNNVGDYFGIFRDTSLDGRSVRVRTRWINGSAAWVYTQYSGDASFNQNKTYSYWDVDKSTQYQLGRSDGIYATAGTNWGF